VDAGQAVAHADHLFARGTGRPTKNRGRRADRRWCARLSAICDQHGEWRPAELPSPSGAPGSPTRRAGSAIYPLLW